MFSNQHLVSKLSKHVDKYIEKLLPNRYRYTGSQSSIQLWRAESPTKSDTSMHGICSPERGFRIVHVEELGNVRSLTTRVERDLGFQGQLGQYIMLTYGDTMYRDEDWSDRFIGMTCNSVGIATVDPTEVYDPLLNDSNHPKCFLEPAAEYGEDSSQYALGITNVIELNPGRGTV